MIAATLLGEDEDEVAMAIERKRERKIVQNFRRKP
jgi:hypothetical protein